METKHTKGEWVAKEGQIYPAETGKTLALIPYFNEDDEEQEANAKLIQAAPDMLRALYNAKAQLEYYIGFNTGTGGEAKILTTIDEAIKKATE